MDNLCMLVYSMYLPMLQRLQEYIHTAVHKVVDLFLSHSSTFGSTKGALLFLAPLVNETGVFGVTGECQYSGIKLSR